MRRRSHQSVEPESGIRQGSPTLSAASLPARRSRDLRSETRSALHNSDDGDGTDVPRFDTVAGHPVPPDRPRSRRPTSDPGRFQVRWQIRRTEGHVAVVDVPPGIDMHGRIVALLGDALVTRSQGEGP